MNDHPYGLEKLPEMAHQLLNSAQELGGVNVEVKLIPADPDSPVLILSVVQHDSLPDWVGVPDDDTEMPITGLDGTSVRVDESSLAPGPALRMTAIQPSDLNDPLSAPREVHVHLPLAAAVLLRDRLTVLIERP